MKVNLFDRLAGILCLILVSTVFVSACNFAQQAPDAARYVKFLALMIGVFALLLITNSFWSKNQEQIQWFGAVKMFGAVALLTVVYVYAMPFAGFYLATAIYTPLTAWCLGLQRYWLMFLVTLGLLIVVRLVFQWFLTVPVPLGSLWGF